MRYALFNGQGRVVTAVNDTTAHDVPAGAVVLTEEQWHQRFDLLLDGDTLLIVPLPLDVGQLKSAKNAAINAARGIANTGTFSHGGKVFSCDPLSRSDIDGVNGYVALFGALPPAFPGAWKAADNSYHLIADVDAWKAFYAAMVAAGAANFAHAQDLKALLAAATTAEGIAAVQW